MTEEEKVKVLVTEEFKSEQGEAYEPGNTYEFPKSKAEKVVEKGYGNRQPEADTEVEKIDMSEGMSNEQAGKINNLAEKLDWNSEQLSSIMKKEFEKESTTELTGDEADNLIDILNRTYARKDADKDEREKAAEEVHGWPSGQAGTKAAQKMVQKDKEQIREEIIGGKISEATIDEYFYQFKQNGKTVTGPTYKGIMAIFRERGNLGLETIDIREEDGNIFVKVRATDRANNNSIERTVKEPADKRFAMRQAESEAQKKATRALVPDEVVTNMYERWKEQSRGRK